MSATSLGWYLRRLRGMSPREVGWRTSDAVRRRRWLRRQVTGWDGLADPIGLLPGTRSFTSPASPMEPGSLPEDVTKGVVVAADQILAGDWQVLGTDRPDIVDPDWFLDVVTGVRAPSQKYSFSVRYRDESEVGNIKALWEVSRHHHLTLLAAGWWVCGDQRYASAVDQQLRSWWDKNPLLSGVHWTSGIEVAIRLISWTWIRRLLAGWDGATALFDDNPQALWQLRWHQEYLTAFPSRGSSSNNHVVAEAAGLLTAACAWPWFAESAGWADHARQLLEKELDHNSFPSGVNRELATDYHRFVTELGLVAAVEAQASGQPLSDSTWALLGRSLDVAAALLDVSGHPPTQGDGDEGRALVVDPAETNPWALLIDTGRRLASDASWWPASPDSVQGAVLAAAAGSLRPVDHPAVRPDVFTDAGITILRTPQGDAPELWCRCDGGPHGFLSIAAHAHADALSIELRHDGVPVLVDPGTYCYHGEPQWRDYFRSTLAHNTVQLDERDQAVSGGPFLWTRHADARTTTGSGTEGSGRAPCWSGEHDGYLSLQQRAVHRRRVRLEPEASRLVVEDEVSAEGPVDLALLWHFGPSVAVDLNGCLAHLSWEGSGGLTEATFELPATMTWSSHRGETDPVLGWYSPHFGHKQPTAALRGLLRAHAMARFTSTLTIVRH